MTTSPNMNAAIETRTDLDHGDASIDAEPLSAKVIRRVVDQFINSLNPNAFRDTVVLFGLVLAAAASMGWALLRLMDGAGFGTLALGVFGAIGLLYLARCLVPEDTVDALDDTAVERLLVELHSAELNAPQRKILQQWSQRSGPVTFRSLDALVEQLATVAERAQQKSEQEARMDRRRAILRIPMLSEPASMEGRSVEVASLDGHHSTTESPIANSHGDNERRVSRSIGLGQDSR